MKIVIAGAGEVGTFLTKMLCDPVIQAQVAPGAYEKKRERLCLDNNSRVLVFGTEGATDPGLYQRIVGRTAAEVWNAG